jgi:hypothetical protein
MVQGMLQDIKTQADYPMREDFLLLWFFKKNPDKA